MPDDRLLPLPVRLLLDAEQAMLTTAEAIPAPGREGHIGPLSAPGGVMAHVAATHSHWFGWYLGGDDSAQSRADPDETRHAAGVEQFRAAAARARAHLEALTTDALTQPLQHIEGTQWDGYGLTNNYMVRRGIAHLYAHAGDLTVTGSLVGMPDQSLPGPLSRCQRIDPADESSRSLVPMLLDGLGEVLRIADALPVPAQVGAFARLNAGSFIVAHVANREDLLWNLGMRGKRDPWLEAANVGPGAPRIVPHWDDARESLDRTIEAITPYLMSLTPSDLAGTLMYRGNEHPIGAQLARSAAHVFYHAGELQALGSLAGMPDLGLPGFLARCARA
jgi:hypothetical protein